MDVRNGRIYTPEELYETFGIPVEKSSGQDIVDYIMRMRIPPTAKQMLRKPPKVSRNELCPCGSGKKFKHCCLRGE